MFRFQMWYLKIAGFEVVPLAELTAFTGSRGGGRKLAALTFDDGFEDFHTHAHPVLKRHGYPSTVFLVSDLVGQSNLWDAKQLGVEKRLLDWDQILRLQDQGVVFGSHTATHPFLSRISRAQADEEIRGSRGRLEERLGNPVDLFCYPYGDYDDATREAVRRAGYRCAVTTRRGFVLPGDDPLQLRRVAVKLNTHPAAFAYKLHSDYEMRKGAPA
jgi:peptidoglycan/xylan/chitin deacetylase (PgdA/CDA1 family)